jgi:hypothetical protein
MQALSLVAEHGSANDVRPNRCDASAESSRRTRVQSVAERKALGTPQAGAGSVSLLYIVPLLPRRDPRATSMIKLAFAAFLLFDRYCVRNKSSGLGREAGKAWD